MASEDDVSAVADGLDYLCYEVSEAAFHDFINAEPLTVERLNLAIAIRNGAPQRKEAVDQAISQAADAIKRATDCSDADAYGRAKAIASFCAYAMMRLIGQRNAPEGLTGRLTERLKETRQMLVLTGKIEAFDKSFRRDFNVGGLDDRKGLEAELAALRRRLDRRERVLKAMLELEPPGPTGRPRKNADRACINSFAEAWTEVTGIAPTATHTEYSTPFEEFVAAWYRWASLDPPTSTIITDSLKVHRSE